MKYINGIVYGCISTINVLNISKWKIEKITNENNLSSVPNISKWTFNILEESIKISSSFPLSSKDNNEKKFIQSIYSSSKTFFFNKSLEKNSNDFNNNFNAINRNESNIFDYSEDKNLNTYYENFYN